MSTNKVSLHRVFTAAPEKVFRAFTDPDAIASWLPPFGFVAKVHQMDVVKGGSYRMSFTNFSSGKSQYFGGQYLEIEPNAVLKYSDRFEDPNMAGEMITHVQFKAVSCGTEICVTQEGIPDMIPVEFCYLGWQESLDKLKRLVEPVIPDA